MNETQGIGDAGAIFLGLLLMLVFCFFGWVYYVATSEKFWGPTFDFQKPRDLLQDGPDVEEPPSLFPPAWKARPSAPSLPRVYRNFGTHTDPTKLAPNACEGDFEQMDERTWQCVRCALLHFEKP